MRVQMSLAVIVVSACRHMLYLFIATTASTALAEPNQLDILGLVPGVSTRQQVVEAGIYKNASESVNLIVGGHDIPCIHEYIESKLAALTCSIKQQGTGQSNAVVHADLVRGFTKKFGKPTNATNFPVRNGLGVVFQNNVVSWKDKAGNELMMFSMVGSVDQGALTMKSSAFLRGEAEKDAAAERSKKF